MPLTSDMTDVLAMFANADLMPATYERATAPSFYNGVPVAGTGGYVSQGPLPVGFTAIVPTTEDEDAESDELMPGGERARGRIVIYTSIQLRAGRNPDSKADVVVTADDRRWRVVKGEDWSASGNFWVAECELIDSDP